MKSNATKYTLVFLTLIFAIAGGYWASSQFNKTETVSSDAGSADLAFNNLPELEELGRIKSKKARNEYFFRMLRDPATNSIPRNIRQRELNHARQLPTFRNMQLRMKTNNPGMNVAEGFDWQLAGPPAVGGRTRALGIDLRNPDILIAGGVSGGVWKSINGGDTWELKTPDAQNFSVTSLTQDPNNPDTWYYVGGELTSGSPGAPGAPYWGNGVFKSTDNGETWNLLANASSNEEFFVDRFNTINRIVVNPQTSTVFIASNGFGIYRSTDGGNSFSNSPVLGTEGEQLFCDVAVAPDGTMAAVISEATFDDQSSQTSGDSPANTPGVFVSADDGQSWTEVTPSTYPATHQRSVITIAPSNPDIIYVFTERGSSDNATQGVSFHKIDISGGANNPVSSDRSANLPDFGEPVGGVVTQGGYNMTVTVKPDNPDVVLVGGINLFRSFDGFATSPSGSTDAEKDEFWVGGYAKENNVSQYPNQHPDQHVQVFDPTNPNRLWVGHDGGISVTNNIGANSVSWTERDEGYIVTQFYDVSIPPGTDDNRFMGGSQDNGTPFFEFDGQQTGGPSTDISSGDGGFSFFTENFIYVSNQQSQDSGNNRVIRFNGDFSGSFAIVQPSDAQTSFFINPYAIDPNDEGIMYYPGGSSLFRNTQADEITNRDNAGAGQSQGWEQLNAATLSNHIISALTVSVSPANILYYAGFNNSQAPVIRRLDNANTSNNAPVEIDIPNAPSGAFVHDIAINPANANDVLVVMSNYNIVGLYHTSNGGSSWDAVEGNLTGNNDPRATNAGPSLRSATIVPSESGPIYLLGTSTGVYATQELNGDLTEWGRESAFDGGEADIGFSVVENITSRFSNGDVAVGTHGRGIFLGRFQGSTNFPFITASPSQVKTLETITLTANNFAFSTNPADNNVSFRANSIKDNNFCNNITISSVAGEVVSITDTTTITVRVPRGILPDECAESNLANVIVNVEGQNTDPAPTSLTILPPNNFALMQNFPNPFNPSTNIPIDLAVDSRVTLTVYDMLGRKVVEPIFNDEYIAGTFNTRIDLSNLASGVYIYRVVAKPMSGNGDPFVETRKMTLIK